LQVMYVDLDFISTFNIELEVLQQFLYEVYRPYNNIPFHNFKHCFCVTQMVSPQGGLGEREREREREKRRERERDRKREAGEILEREREALEILDRERKRER